MMGEVDIDTLTIEQYLMLNQGNQEQGMVETKFGGMMKKDIEDMTIAEYMEYEANMKRQTWRNAQSCFPTKHENKDINSLNHDKSRVLGYKHHFDDSNINAYYDLPPLLPCFKPVQLHTKDRYEPLEKDTDYVSEDESETGEQRMSNDTVDDKPFTPKPQPEGEQLSFDKDLDEWLKAEIEKHMCGQDKESEEDTLIHILKLLVGECKVVYTNKSTQIKASSHGTTYLGASVNVMPKSIFEYLKLANLKETDMVVEMADMTKKDPLRIVENILVKINKFLFPSDFVIIDMLGEPSETTILGRLFLATIHAQIDVFKRVISLGIGEDIVVTPPNRVPSE
ncbi:putative ribonuclease H-like domain-containing protein [Tanacetum coccineum]